MNTPPVPSLIAMVHLAALPGSPRARLEVGAIVDAAVREAVMLKDAGFDAVLLENMHDRPYRRGACGPETVAVMAVAARAVREAVAVPCGIQILAAANQGALAVALAAGAAFVRVEGYAYAHLADEGWIESDAAELLRYRRAIGGEAIRVFADIKKKHSSHAVTADVGLAETARTAEFMLADGVIVTGNATGEAPVEDAVESVRQAVDLPVFVGSGVTAGNARSFLRSAHGVIVGSALKSSGCWDGPVDGDRARAFVEAARRG